MAYVPCTIPKDKLRNNTSVTDSDACCLKLHLAKRPAHIVLPNTLTQHCRCRAAPAPNLEM